MPECTIISEQGVVKMRTIAWTSITGVNWDWSSECCGRKCKREEDSCELHDGDCLNGQIGGSPGDELQEQRGTFEDLRRVIY